VLLTSAPDGWNAPAVPADPVPAPDRRRAFPAFRYPNYRLWFAGQLVSLFGTWMQATAQGYLVYELTRSPAYLGYVGFAGGLPVWLFTLYAGVISDRIPRRAILVVTQAAMMIPAFTLAALVFSGLVRPWHIMGLAFALGTANAFDAPARQAFVSDLVDREDLTNAIALNATMFNAATAVGPAVAGLTYEWWGPGWCFALNGLSFLAVIAALLAMRFPASVRRTGGAPVRDELKLALRFIGGEPVIVALIGLVGAVSLVGMAFITLLPAWAVTVLRGDAATNGLLLSARGTGALLGALLLASLGRFRFKGRLLTAGTLALPVLLVLFSFTGSIGWSVGALGAIGAATILVVNLANALVQTLVPDALRGRVMSVYMLTFFGCMPLGALWIGPVAQAWSLQAVFGLSAAASLGVAALVWVAAPRVRRLA
jgi:predicted MFS family arabinose efflux permease